MGDSTAKDHDYTKSSAWDAAAAATIHCMTKYNSVSRSAYSTIFQGLEVNRPFSNATTILDIGCGPGIGIEVLSESFSKDLPAEFVLKAIDFSPAMIQALEGAKLNYINKGIAKEIWSKVKGEVLDVTKMNTIASGSVSHALANYVLFGVSDSSMAFQEILRVLEPGGVVAMTSFSKVGWIDCMGSIKGVIDRELKFPTMSPTDPWTTVDGVKQKLDTAGFIDTHAGEFEVVMEVDSIKEFPYDMMDVPSLSAVRSALTPEEMDRGAAAVTDTLRNNYTTKDGKIKIPASCIVGWGRRKPS
ncbi:MAG: hypothetical protein GOMPHAMPRED_005379 [Gomphillus americanus]|uniref:Methyltransferase type 11 domain-containing protein n=1 Tax=Gomphillus americanus TaxID=1940652 RepID=A0A8H3FR82_9LECA|nr:MAG: hypothetical protein GOMPHAMPRED_005379 [Gomphillus americanus]